MLLSAVSVLVVEQPSSEIPEGLMNYPVLYSPYNLLGLNMQRTVKTDIVFKITRQAMQV
jgi:hypothetical protein